MKDPLAHLHQTAVHQLRKAVEDIENGHGLVKDFDHDEETDDYYAEMGRGVPDDMDTERTVTIELTYLLPE